MKTRHALFTAIFLLLSAVAFTQNDSMQEKKAPVEFKLGIYYNSNLHYLGRTDSLKSNAVFPMAELWIGNGFYINAAPIFVNNASRTMSYEGSVATIGYRFNNQQNKFGGNLYFVKPLYKDGSQLVQSALKGQFSSTFTASNNFLNVTMGGDLRFSDKVDYGATGGLDHLFRFEPGNNFVLVLDPSAYVFAGTQQFTRSYYKQTGFPLFPGTEQLVTEDVKRFAILAYEFSMPVILAKGKLQLIANPAYVIPQNLIQVEGQPGLSERGKEMFYITLGGKITL
jgi:hypothetical protein